jgi:hypothetical protein
MFGGTSKSTTPEGGMDSEVWVPLASVVIGGLLTTISSLLVEIVRDRARSRQAVRQRRRGVLEELERVVTDGHSKILSNARLMEALQPKPQSAVEPPGDGAPPQTENVDRSRDDTQLVLTVMAETTGKLEVLRAVGLAARVGSEEIKRAANAYAEAQVEWTKSPINNPDILAKMEAEMKI